MGMKFGPLHCVCMVCFLAVASFAYAGSDLRLVEAVKKGDKQTISSLLSQRIDVNAASPDGATALHWAAHWDDLETAEALIRAGADVNALNDLAVSPLALACSNGSAAMVAKLLKAGANAASVQRDGQTAIMICARTGNVEAVKSLLAQGANVNAKESQRGQTALMWAAAEEHPEVVRALIEKGADVHARSKGGFTPLLFAARAGDLASTRLLLAGGADINEGTAEDGTALIVASASGHEALAIFLLEKGANPNVTDGSGVTPLHYAAHKGLSLVAGVALKTTIESYLFRPNMLDLAKTLLAHGANPNARITKVPAIPSTRNLVITIVGATPFLLAAACYDANFMRLLVANGADPLVAAEDKTTPLMLAAGLAEGLGELPPRTAEDDRNALEAVKLSVELGADVNAANKTGQTALHAAAYVGSDAIVDFLASKGANVNAKENYGQTPLSIAEKLIPPELFDDNLRPYFLHTSTATVLRKWGATPVNFSQERSR